MTERGSPSYWKEEGERTVFTTGSYLEGGRLNRNQGEKGGGPNQTWGGKDDAYKSLLLLCGEVRLFESAMTEKGINGLFFFRREEVKHSFPLNIPEMEGKMGGGSYFCPWTKKKKKNLRKK